MVILAIPQAWADMPLHFLYGTDAQALKPVAIIYFDNSTDIAHDRRTMIEGMIKEASQNLGLAIRNYVLPNEDTLPEQVEKIADDGIGMIVIIEPQKINALAKIPSLYPDIDFTVIGVNTPLYLANVRSMVFRDQEGTYLMGVLAALRTKTGTIGFISKSDDETTRNLAYAFLQGAKRTNPDIMITEELGDKITHGTSTASIPKSVQKSESKADITFVLDDELLDSQIRTAGAQKKFIITYDHDLTNAYPGIVLTSLIKHYDLAIYHILRRYAQGQWRSGSQSMGVANSFLDYVLNNSNKALMPKETIGQLEMNKDFISQNVLQINALGK